MHRPDQRADRLLDALGAGSAGFGAAVSAWLVSNDFGLSSLVWSALAGILGMLGGMIAMRAVPAHRAAAPVPFAIATIETRPDEDALLLEDVLIELEPDSRVVQLFAPDAMPTAGQLRARIDQHLGRSDQPDWTDATAHHDEAASALHAALNDIRRTLRQH